MWELVGIIVSVIVAYHVGYISCKLRIQYFTIPKTVWFNLYSNPGKLPSLTGFYASEEEADELAQLGRIEHKAFSVTYNE